MAKQDYLPAWESDGAERAGHDGVDLESQRGAETAWTYLAFDSARRTWIARRTLPPPLANPNPHPADYRMRYGDDDVQVGVFSDILSVTVGP